MGYENDNTLEIQGHGSGGVDELLDSLANNQVQYSLLRLSYVSQDNIQKVRDVFIYWTGPNVSVVQRGKKKTHVGAVQQILKVCFFFFYCFSSLFFFLILIFFFVFF